jgi:RimJ/RimL family protein N-acetyltransferase
MNAFERVETDRLLLRRPRFDDLDEHHRIHGDSRVRTHSPESRHTDRAASEQQLRQWLAHWDDCGFGYWTVEREGRVIGFGGLWLLGDWNGRGDVLNVYYRVEPESRGHGYATELVRAALDLRDRELAALPVVARILPGNEESIRVAERSGLRRRPDLDEGRFLVWATAGTTLG